MAGSKGHIGVRSNGVAGKRKAVRRTSPRVAEIDGVWYEARGAGMAHRVIGYNEEKTDKGYRLNAVVMACGHRAKPGSGDIVPAFDVCNRKLCDSCKDYTARAGVRKERFRVGRIEKQ